MTQGFLKSLEDPNGKMLLLRSAAKMNLVKALDEGTNIRTLKLLHKNQEEYIEMMLYKVFDLGRELLMIEKSESQKLVLMNIAVEVLECPDNAIFTFEEIIYAVRKGASGGYGKTYNKINLEVVNHWLDELYKEHMTEIETRHDRKKDHNESTRSKAPALVNSFDDLVRSEVNRRMKFIDAKKEDQ